MLSMALIVQKYGGTSVGSIDRIKKVASRIKAEREKGNQVVAVISAMGGETDKLISLASELSQSPKERELDVLLSSGEQQSIALLTIALNEMGIEAVSATGRQAGILTSGSHTRGRIEQIDPTLINQYLEADQTVVIAGFQGITKEGMIHTLGRGGSDLSAIAVASSVKA
jgi:aspartate kinase